MEETMQGSGLRAVVPQAEQTKIELIKLPDGRIVMPSGKVVSTVSERSDNTNNGTGVKSVRKIVVLKDPQKFAGNGQQIMEHIEEAPLIHIGLRKNKLSLLKDIICPMAEVSLSECYLTLKKLRTNESFVVLGQYFELSYDNAQSIFVKVLLKLANCLRYLVSWPDDISKVDRLKKLPFEFRGELQNIEALVDCVETQLGSELNLGFASYKYIICMSPTGIITHVSNAYNGSCDDIEIIKASQFHKYVPAYVTLAAAPGIYKSKSNDTLKVENNRLKSENVKGLNVPVLVDMKRDPGREKLDEIISLLREFKILAPYGMQHPLLMKYAHQILVVCAALTNLLHN